MRVELLKDHFITVVGCYRPPSANCEALPSLSRLLASLDFKELFLTGDFDLDWLSSVSDSFKSLCDSFNLKQLVNGSTRPNFKNPVKSTLLDLVLTNTPHKVSHMGIFSNDLSDHCAVAVVRQAKLPKARSLIVLKRDFKHFCDQAFLRDLWEVDWKKISLINDVELAWDYFYNFLKDAIDKHAPYRKFRVKGRTNPWFSSELSALKRERDAAWTMARKSSSQADWLRFRQLRNRFTSEVKKAKSNYYLSETTKNLKDPKKFWRG